MSDRVSEPTFPTILTNMCLITDGKKLVLEERIGKNYRGYLLPGGHVEPREPFTEAVIREVREETGLTVARPILRGIKDWISEDGTRYIVFLYLATEWTGELTSSEEGQVLWAERDKLDALPYPLIWNMEEIIDIIENPQSGEFFFDLAEGYGEDGQVRWKMM